MVDAASAAIAGSKTPKEALDAAAKVIEAALKDGGYKQ
jgi:ABC-type glycerol-3-phosphate transport system substrate-binding protein